MGKVHEISRLYFDNVPKIKWSMKNKTYIFNRCLIFRSFWDIIKGYDIVILKETIPMTDTYPIRIGVIGTNFVSDWLCEAADTLDCVEITAVYSRAQETGDAFAEKHHIPHVFTDYDAFLSSDVIDAVNIASPNFAHAAQAVRALNAGKHVLCEKVIASNSREL